MTIKQELLKVQREIGKITTRVEKLGAAIDKLEAKKAAKPKAGKKTTAKRKAAPKKAPKKTTASKKAAKKSAALSGKDTKVSDAQKVIDLVKGSEDGIPVKTLRAETGFDAKKISNILYKASKAGQIKAVKRGVYAAA